jgi:L-malate glycosyltransferase
MPTVIIAQSRMVHYRAPLYEHLRSRLATEGVQLRVVHGTAHGQKILERDEAVLPWAELLPARRLPGTGGRAVWLPVASVRHGAALVIVPERVGWLATYELLARRRVERFRLACWGHGPGAHDHAPSRASRGVRYALARRFDWWFSYTEGTTQRLMDAGVSRSRISTLNNTIDVQKLRRALPPANGEHDAVAQRLRLAGSSAAYIGALRPNKRIDLLLETGQLISERIPDFVLVIGGDGPMRSLVESAAATSPWLRYVGPVFGEEKAQILGAVQLMLQPAWLGLVVLDAFAAGLPIVSFDRASHSPEEEYLADGVHGYRVSGNRTSDLAAAAVKLLQDEDLRARMGAAAYSAGSTLTIEAMSDRFARGIQQALA